MNTTNPQLQLSQGAVSLALLKVGGQLLQQECDNKAPINVGDVAITGPGNLRCRHVLHTVLPGYKKRSVEAEKVLFNINVTILLLQFLFPFLLDPTKVNQKVYADLWR